jgi:hypothetical protein
MVDPMEPTEPRGKVDLRSLLYIAFGIPAIVGFLFVLFSLARAFDLPA